MAAKTTIFSVMSAMAQQHGAINLAQGFPDYPVPDELGKFLREASLNGYNQYAPMAGLPMLTAAIAEDLTKRYGLSIDAATEITVTPGATYAIYTALQCTLEPGDEAIVLEPAYDSYVPNILSAKAVPVCVPLLPGSYRPDWQRISDAITDKTRAIIINTPNNPIGALWQDEDFEELAALIRNRNITVVSDEVYEQLVFDGQKHRSVLQHPELREKSFAIFSFGKVFQNTGWKVGYCIAPPALMPRFQQLHQYLAFSVSTPSQYALAQYMALPEKPDWAALLQGRRDLLLRLLVGTPFRATGHSEGTFFQTIEYGHLNKIHDRAFAELLVKEYRVATIPVSAFYQNGTDHKLLRLCFAKKEETLRAAIKKLAWFPE